MVSHWIREHLSAPPDLLVVGAGLVGLSTALFHQRRHPRHRVLVLERGPHPDGATVRNAGFACFGSPGELLSDIASEGEEKALARVEERWRGLQMLRQELGDAHIGFENCGGHEVFIDERQYTHVAEGFDRLNGLLKGLFGRPPYEWHDHRIGDLGLVCAHLCHTPLEGSLNSGALMRTLLTRASTAGVEVRHWSPVVRLEEEAAGMQVILADGLRVLARQVLLATNGYTGGLLPRADLLPARGQVLLTRPVPGLRLRGTFHAEEGYVYFRHLDDRVLIGGGRQLDKAGETTSQHGTTPLVQGYLEDLLRTRVLPGVTIEVEQRWSGIMGFGTKGKDPLVERISPHLCAALRLSGMGVAIGMHVAERTVDLLEEAW